MGTGGIISAIIAGLIIGALARLVLPGRQPLGILLTLLVGVVGAFVGGAVADGFTTSFWITLLVQVIVAVVLVAITSALLTRRGKTHRTQRVA